MADFSFKANLKEIADKLGQTTDAISARIKSEVGKLSISTHAFVVAFANERLTGFNRDHFFGKNNKNVRWTQVADGYWVVEIDESVRWIEEGRPQPTFMGDWLLKPGAPGVKTAKDGSKFRVIPMNQTKNSQKDPILFHNIKYALQQNNIDMKKITRGSDNKPILGVVAKLGIKEKRTSYPEMHFSEPRNRQTANKLGLPETHGHHYLDNAVVTQRKVGGKVKKEVVTFRVISSKHKQEGRWFYPKVEALNSIPEAYKYANEEWGKIVNSLQQEFTKGLE
jgi:hypothetical protein